MFSVIMEHISYAIQYSLPVALFLTIMIRTLYADYHGLSIFRTFFVVISSRLITRKSNTNWYVCMISMISMISMMSSLRSLSLLVTPLTDVNTLISAAVILLFAFFVTMQDSWSCILASIQGWSYVLAISNSCALACFNRCYLIPTI